MYARLYWHLARLYGAACACGKRQQKDSSSIHDRTERDRRSRDTYRRGTVRHSYKSPTVHGAGKYYAQSRYSSCLSFVVIKKNKLENIWRSRRHWKIAASFSFLLLPSRAATCRAAAVFSRSCSHAKQPADRDFMDARRRLSGSIQPALSPRQGVATGRFFSKIFPVFLYFYIIYCYFTGKWVRLYIFPGTEVKWRSALVHACIYRSIAHISQHR